MKISPTSQKIGVCEGDGVEVDPEIFRGRRRGRAGRRGAGERDGEEGTDGAGISGGDRSAGLVGRSWQG